jgi:LmbE family N-acetylglucosaminyl deacetylase
MAELIVLSPHLDDAVLSLGATIARAVERGDAVEVVSFFTQAPPPAQVPEKLRVFADYSVRHAEDTDALASLGATPRWIGLIERAFRKPPLRTLTQVFRTPEDEREFVNLSRMQEIIHALLREHPRAQIRAPLAVGHHVDHVEVFVAAARTLAATRAWDRISFYEDPYALGRRMRRQHFVTRRQGWGRIGGPDAVSVRFRGMLRVMAFARRGPAVERYVPDAVRDASWTVERDAFEPRHAQAKLDAIARYPSQVEALGGLRNWAKALARYHRFWGDAEPRWVCRPLTGSESGAA